MSSLLASPLHKAILGNIVSLVSLVLLLVGAQAVVWFHGDLVTVGANSHLVAVGASIVGLLMILNVLSINILLLVAAIRRFRHM